MVSAPALSALWGLLGLALAPLANILITRLPNGEPIIASPILCPACGIPQSLPDLISLPFFLFRGGRCRHRGLPLPGRLPLAEASLALALALVAARTGWSALLPVYTFYTFVLLLV
ncbi:MAG: prepilin peptidase, partial [Chloroflexi bacterium]|nr:prepilin peptidase [Chloroflexota bacterium]